MIIQFQKEDAVEINPDEKQKIKAVLVDLMLSVSDSRIQKVLAEALSIISETEFPTEWPSLLPVCI